MKKLLQLLFVLSSVAVCLPVAGASSLDTGKVKVFYASGAGAIGVILDSGYPNAQSSGQCVTANDGGWGGSTTADPILKSTLLAAKASQQSVTIVIQGCEMGGNWYKITDVYVN